MQPTKLCKLTSQMLRDMRMLVSRKRNASKHKPISEPGSAKGRQPSLPPKHPPWKKVQAARGGLNDACLTKQFEFGR